MTFCPSLVQCPVESVTVTTMTLWLKPDLLSLALLMGLGLSSLIELRRRLCTIVQCETVASCT